MLGRWLFSSRYSRTIVDIAQILFANSINVAQISCKEYEHGAKVDAKTKLGWTPLDMAKGIFFANAKKEYPAAAEILKSASR